MQIEHLRILATKVAIDHPGNASVLSDLTQTYAWLDVEVRKDYPSRDFGRLLDLRNVPLFLNVDDPTASDWTFKCADLLLISTLDDDDTDGDPASSGQIDIVRNYLKPFAVLLRCAGLPQIEYPLQPPLYTPSPDSQNSLRSSVGSLRCDGTLTDVVFLSRTGEKVPAHRLICLATGSEYFRGLFLGGFQESLHTQNPVTVVAKYLSTDCLNSVLGEQLPVCQCIAMHIMLLTFQLDYIYHENFPTSQKPDDELCDILLCAHYWQLQGLFEATQNRLVFKLNWKNFQYCE
jgi:hypothetical protein